jgi:hypothetical protein
LTLLIGESYAQFIYKENRKHINASIGYYSILDLSAEDKKFKSGASLSLAYSLANKSREKLQRKTSINRVLDRDIYMKMNFSTYKRAEIHQTFSVSAGPAFRITIPEGMFYEFDGQVGYMRTFLKGDHYTFEDGDISTTKGLGSNLMSLQGNAIIGWNFTKSNDYPVALYTGVGIMSYFPNNGKWLFQPQFQAGLTFVLVRLKESYPVHE